jgi:two-component system, NarL family, nitrate/nitrite response regulator NarL
MASPIHDDAAGAAWSPGMPIRLVIADDHPLILAALQRLFGREPDFQLLACCQNGVETLQALKSCQPDVLILDMYMPDQDGLAVLREMRQEHCSTRVVLLTAGLAEHEALEAVRLGAQGMVLKEMPSHLLVQCVRTVHAGEQWFERHSGSRALQTILRHQDALRDVMRLVTPRELEIMRLAAQGFCNKSIADTLAVSEGTVKIHMHNVYKKLSIDSRLGLSLYAREKGLV